MSVPTSILSSLVGLLVALVLAAAGDGTSRAEPLPVLRATSPSPMTELGMMPKAEAMPGTSAAVAVVTQYVRRAGAVDAGAREHGIATDVILGGSVAGRLQLAVGVAGRVVIAERVVEGTPAVVGPALDGLRVDARLVLRRREPGGMGLGVALLGGMDLSAESWRPSLYRPGVVIDQRFAWLHLATSTSVALRPAMAGAPLGVRLDHATGLAVVPCARCGLSFGAGIDAAIVLAGGGPAAWDEAPYVVRAVGWLGWSVPDSRAGLRVFGAVPLGGSGRAGDFLVGLGLSWDAGGARDAHGYGAAKQHAPVGREQSADGRSPPGPRFAGPGVPRLSDVNLVETYRDATAAIELANRRYLGPALAERGLEALQEVVGGTVAGVAITAAIAGVASWYGLGVNLTALLLRLLGVSSLALFSAQKYEQLQSAFGPFLGTAAMAHGDREQIDLAARHYADAVALLCGATAEALFFVAAARGIEPVLKWLRGTRLDEVLGIEWLRAWLFEGTRRVREGGGPAVERAVPAAGGGARAGGATTTGEGTTTGAGGGGAAAGSGAARSAAMPPAPRTMRGAPATTLPAGGAIARGPAVPELVVEPAPALTPQNVDAVIAHIAARRHINAKQVRLIRKAARTQGEKWNLPDPLRGEVSHALNGENLPRGQRVIDKQVRGPDGRAVEVGSIKSHQPYAAGFRKPGALLAQLKAEIDAVAAYSGSRRRGETRVRMEAQTRRVLEVEVPPDTIGPEVPGRPRGDPALRAQMRQEATEAMRYARERGVELRFKAAQP